MDEQALDRRVKGEAFSKIAKTLGMARSIDANRAFIRALNLRPPAEQSAIREQESRRLDRLAEAVRSNTALDAAEAEKRLQTIEQLRARLVAQ